MPEVLAFFAATDRLALWTGRVIVWGTLLMILAGALVGWYVNHRDRRSTKRLRAIAVRQLSRDLDTEPRFRMIEAIEAERLLREVGLTREFNGKVKRGLL